MCLLKANIAIALFTLILGNVTVIKEPTFVVEPLLQLKKLSKHFALVPLSTQVDQFNSDK